MAESSGEKTEQPTPKKLRDSRQKGQVAKSQDLTMALSFLALSMTLVFQGGRTMQLLSDHMVDYLGQSIVAPPLTPDSAFELLKTSLDVMFQVIGPFLAVAFVFGGLVAFAQVGPLFTGEPMKAQLSKLDPIKGAKNKFFSAQTYIELAKSILKIIIVGVFVYVVLNEQVRDVALTVRHSLEKSRVLTGDLIKDLTLRIGLVFIVIGAVDVFIQRWQHIKKLKMSKDEVKREHKQQEGDPEYKGHRKRMHTEILQHSMVENVKNADVVIVNPTHLAIAIKYEKGKMRAPQVMAKGQRLVAEQIREVARQYRIPIMRSVPLAHALIQLEVGDDIPEDLYAAVASVLNWVYEQKQG